MRKSIHTLELLIPGKNRQGTVTSGSAVTTVYHWPCDCIATGEDPEVLSWAACAAHSEIMSAERTNSTTD